MDTKDSNIKPQQTGGLKLMTVFIAVLALHVVVIGGITVYHLMSGGSTDADLTAADKTHKSPAIADGILPDASQGDKSTPAPAPPAEVATIPANPPVSTPAPAAAPIETAPVSTPAPAPALATPAPMTSTPPTDVVDQGTPSGPIPAAELAPPPEPAPVSAPMVSGPVHMPPAATPMPAPASQQIYTVKITDSYKKIAHAHHLTVAQLKEANHIRGDVLHTGQKLVIPSAKTLVATTTPAPVLDSTPSGPIWSESAPTATLTASSSISSTGVPYRHLYTVVKGDTLIKIAHKFKTTPTALMTENSITDPTKLAIGKKLKIPSRESRSARNGTPSSTQPGQVQAKETAPSAQLANFVP